VRAARPPDARGRGSGARDRRPRLLRPAGRSGIIGLLLSTGDYSTATAGLTLTSNQSRAEGSSYRPMLTIFAVPKPFKGHVGVIQRNALGSWVRLAETVILFGDEEGIADAARDLGARHVPEVARNRFGTPLLDGVFGKAQLLCATPWLVYANGDIILREDFRRAVSLLPRRPCLLAGRRWNLDITEPIDFDQPDWSEALERRALKDGVQGGRAWIDYFAFRPGTLGEIPPFAVGRPRWDNWLMLHARANGFWLVDATPSVMVIHQNHDYSHVPNAVDQRWKGPEADANKRLAGSRRLFSLEHATHHVLEGRVVRKRRDIADLTRQWKRLPKRHPELKHEPDLIRRFTRPRCKTRALKPFARLWYAALNDARVPLIPLWRRLHAMRPQ
jgi:hypothetical protein